MRGVQKKAQCAYADDFNDRPVLDSTKSRYSLASKGDKFSARALCGLADIVVGVTKVAISPFNLFLFGSPKEALFDVVSIP